MRNDPKIRRDIYIGVIVAVLVMLLVEPLLQFASNTILRAGENIYHEITDSIYKSAALGLREKYSFMTLEIFFGVLVGFYTVVSLVLFLPKRPLPKKRGKMIRKNSSRIKYIVLVLISTSFPLMLYLAGGSFAELQLNASFNQRLTVLAPKLSDLQLKILRAGWAAMEKRTDYVAINAEMESLATKLDVKLPANLWE